MEDVTFDIDHDVLIVSVLDLQNVAKEGVGGQRLHEVLPGGLVCLCASWTKLAKEVINESFVLTSELLFDTWQVHGVGSEF